MNYVNSHRTIDSIKNVNILVIGDVMLDSYQYCDVKRISPEAPVPVAAIKSDSHFLGGAANVANNARALGAHVSVFGVVGGDSEANVIRNLLEEQSIRHRGLISEKKRPTTVKRRIVSGTQQLMRIDREVTDDITEETEKLFRMALEEEISECDIIIVSDYCKGLLTKSIIGFVKQRANELNKKVFVDSKTKHLPLYAGVHVIKPNKSEAETFLGESFMSDYRNLNRLGMKMSGALKASIVITLGGDGIALFESGNFVHKKTEALQVFDVSGAGDTVLSVLATAVAAGASLEDAVYLSNLAAGYVVSRLGTTVCDYNTLKEIIG